jgi:hypothetical protein
MNATAPLNSPTFQTTFRQGLAQVSPVPLIDVTKFVVPVEDQADPWDENYPYPESGGVAGKVMCPEGKCGRMFATMDGYKQHIDGYHGRN